MSGLQQTSLSNNVVEINISDNLNISEIKNNDIILRLEGNYANMTFNMDVIARKKLEKKFNYYIMDYTG
jgi:hypothetical protein